MFFEGTLAAGETEKIGGGAHFQFFIIECGNEYLDVDFMGNDIPYLRMYKGVPAQFDLPYKNAIIKNPHATSIDYKIYCAPRNMKFFEGRNVEAGPTSIVGNVGVVGQPLTDDGGSIQSVGLSNYTSVIAASTAYEIVSAAANTAGVIIRTLSIKNTAAGLITCTIGSGAYVFVLNNDNYHLGREIYIPAGNPFTVSGGSGAGGNVYTTYDIL